MAGLTREEFATPEGRRRAWRALMVGDHGALRKFYNNTHTVVPDKVYRSYQPSPADLERWKERGIRTVVNLRGPKPSAALFLEDEACERLGLALRNFRVYSREAPSAETLRGARALFEEIEYPALLHCKSGADRAGLMATLYLFFQEGRPLDEAMDQLSWKYGHVRQGKTGVIDAALEAYIAHARATDIPLTDVSAFFNWVETAYDPAAVKRDFRGSFWGRMMSERILRRE